MTELSGEDLKVARKRYNTQKNSCKNKNKRDTMGDPVEMKMTFLEWLQIWITSGKYHLCGNRKGCYVMARKNDRGHYEIGNVDIVLGVDNIKFAQTGEKSHFFGLDFSGDKNPMFGRSGEKSPSFGKIIPAVDHGSFKGTVVATNVETGAQIFMDGNREMIALGFDPSSISKCIRGKYGTHNIYHGHRFQRIQ